MYLIAEFGLEAYRAAVLEVLWRGRARCPG